MDDITAPLSRKLLWLRVAKSATLAVKNAILPDGTLVGDTLAAQTEQAYKNTLEILKTVGASQENVVKQTILLLKDRTSEKVLLLHKKSGEISQPQVAWPSLKVLAFLEQ